jgi:inorganic pyrophosphatase
MKAFVQNEAGSRIKNSHNEKTLKFVGTSQVSRPYPFPYGFILETTAEDGLNVDCFFLTEESLKTGQIVECEPIGLMEQLEDGKADHNVLAVIRGEKALVNKTAELTLTEFVSRVFEHIPGKKITVGRFRGRDAALKFISSHRDRASTNRK